MTGLLNLAVIAVLAAGTPIVAWSVLKGLAPGIVVELVVGLVVGPHGLGWISLTGPVDTLAQLGLAFLFFLAGLDIDLSALRGELLLRSLSSYAAGFVVALGCTCLLRALGLVSAPVLLAVALSATGLGLVVPLLREAALLTTPLGHVVAAAGSVAEFSAVVFLALGFSSAHSPLLKITFLGVLVALTLAVTLAARRLGARAVVTSLIDRLSNGTAQLRVRLSVTLIVGFAALAQALGLELVLGAFFAGGILNVLDRGMRNRDFRSQLDGIGFGLLIPIFFIVSGAKLDLASLSWWPDSLVVPLLVAALLAARGLPTFLLQLDSKQEILGVGLLCATSLPFIVTATQVGLQQGRLDLATAAAVTSAGLIGVCLFPTLGIRALRTGGASSAEAGPHPPT